ncbi:MAG TPA: hypothetical protein VI895_01190 [Bdellovibrionota bacterium]|nr:hypothetical protein [Bdellovibrionota bacterium]
MPSPKYKSIFAPSKKDDRNQNFLDYWEFSRRHSGEIFEDEKDLSKKREKLAYFQANPVRSRKPLVDPESFYRNYVKLVDDPKTLDRKTLLLTCVYKFARHEWVGISGAWDAIPSMARTKSVTDRISRYHLAEEFCHVRFFHEMFRTFHLDRVEWVPLGPLMGRVYRLFPYVPEALMAPPAFITELMGITFYRHVDGALDDIFADEVEACARVRELLYEIMVDEIAHIGQRRNFIGNVGIRAAHRMVGPLYRMFYRDIPESRLLFNIDQMVKDGEDFEYGSISPQLLERSWIPSYCKAM